MIKGNCDYCAICGNIGILCDTCTRNRAMHDYLPKENTHTGAKS